MWKPSHWHGAVSEKRVVCGREPHCHDVTARVKRCRSCRKVLRRGMMRRKLRNTRAYGSSIRSSPTFLRCRCATRCEERQRSARRPGLCTTWPASDRVRSQVPILRAALDPLCPLGPKCNRVTRTAASASTSTRLASALSPDRSRQDGSSARCPQRSDARLARP